MSELEISLEAVPSVADVPASEWDDCANPENGDFNPFVSHAFFSALEASGSACAKTGWKPCHLVARVEGAIAGIVPCYLKSHSQGEYVFDHGWADAYQRAGGHYYPKLQVCAPFTPATGRRFLIRPGQDAEAVRDGLLAGAKAALASFGGSSIHITFIGREDWERLGARGFLQRTDQQFHWLNEGYAGFEDFLAVLASRKRKTIKRERRDAMANGISIERLTGAAITEEAWDAFFAFYMDTGSRKWGRPYLNRAFYAEIGAAMADRILLVMARRQGRYVAGAINFIGSDTLYGRHWGCIEDHPFLHFEICYHQAIEFAIEQKLERVEAGAPGGAKAARGY